MVHGKPRHPQSQGSVERANCDIKDMLVAWLGDNQTTDWVVGLKFVQFQKNSSYHSGTKRSPFAPLFGSDAKVGLTTSVLPHDVIHCLQSEDDLLSVITDETTSVEPPAVEPPSVEPPAVKPPFESTSVEPPSVKPPSVEPPAPTSVEPPAVEPPSIEPPTVEPPVEPTSVEPPSVEPPAVEPPVEPTSVEPPSVKPTSVEPTSPLSVRQNNIISHRKRAYEAKLSQAERMVKRSRRIMDRGNVGNNVTIPIPMVDRSRGDPRNIMGMTVDIDENDNYTIAMKSGIVSGKYTKNQFDLCTYELYSEDDVTTDRTVSLRSAVQHESKSGGRGFAKCNCAGSKRCQTNRCKCFKLKVKCSSRCHSSLHC
ncbi:uncharacterized protein LOC143034260 [Oratosquilla oratoria]|uniref:uncharacterized protein LOC143034260 n=1 Tax=Oratosquilla oratoria TaxID=337810 RepID=UPI003F772878